MSTSHRDEATFIARLVGRLNSLNYFIVRGDDGDAGPIEIILSDLGYPAEIVRDTRTIDDAYEAGYNDPLAPEEQVEARLDAEVG